MNELTEQGWIFLGKNNCVYRCCMWDDQAWLFALHPSNLWVSVRPVTQMDIWTFPHNLTLEQQQLYRDLADTTAANLVPQQTDTP